MKLYIHENRNEIYQVPITVFGTDRRCVDEIEMYTKAWFVFVRTSPRYTIFLIEMRTQINQGVSGKRRCACLNIQYHTLFINWSIERRAWPSRLWKAKLLRNVHRGTRFNALCNASELVLVYGMVYFVCLMGSEIDFV